MERVTDAVAEVFAIDLNRDLLMHKKVALTTKIACPSNDRKRPPNVPQRYANQAMHARYALHAR